MTDDITALRYYVTRLEEDLVNADLEAERLRKYSSRQALDIVTLGQEVGRLREALEKIATIQGGGDCCSVYEWSLHTKQIALAALAEQKSTQEK